MRNNGYFPNFNMNHRMPQRKIGLWDCVLAGVAAGAAVKIVRTIANRKDVNDDYDDDRDISEEEYDPNAPIDYLLYSSDSIKDVLKCRRKIAELADLYGCYTEKEILDLMGEKTSEDLEHKVLYDSTKYAIRYKNKKYCLYSQAPVTIFDDLDDEKEDATDEEKAD
ncbi:MAG: hypothetical protein J6Y02_02495 [Pseudobutyrivibrio sp.]|nr:hypothetical protein [Pseudobutyrivibrio sp.]